MKPEITEEILLELLNFIKDSKTFVVEQAPQIAQEILTYNIIENWTQIFVALAIILICIGASFYIKLSSNVYDKQLVIFPILISICSTIFAIVQALMIVKINVAPKLYILNYLKNYIL